MTKNTWVKIVGKNLEDFYLATKCDFKNKTITLRLCYVQK